MSAGEGGRRQRVERADALLEKLPRHLKDGLRKAVIETQLVGTGGVVNNELPRGYDSFAAILKHAVHALRSQCHQHEIFAGTGDPGRRAQNPLRAGVNSRTRTGPIIDCETEPQNASRMSERQSSPTKISQTMSCHTASRRFGAEELVSSTTATMDLLNPPDGRPGRADCGDPPIICGPPQTSRKSSLHKMRGREQQQGLVYCYDAQP